MKYSILMPYLRRFTHLNNTLVSFDYWYGDRDDYELIIVEDTKNQMDSVEHTNLLSLIEDAGDICPTVHIKYTTATYNPAGMFNQAAAIAGGQYIILTNPECFHEADILGGLDGYFNEDPEQYVVCSCKSIFNQPLIDKYEDMKYDTEMWYISNEHYKRYIHFCSCISKTIFDTIGGFDEEYMKFVGWEDTDFVQKVDANGISKSIADDLVVLHQSHSRQYSKSYNHQQLYEAGRKYYNNKWGLNA